MNFNLRKKILSFGECGDIQTPFFMPDATRGYVKGVSMEDLELVGVGPMVVNTLHLYLEPGLRVIKKFKVQSSKFKMPTGNIHNFMNWRRPLLSDSGGFQVFSLIHKNPKMGKIFDDKVVFRSPLDGSRHEITPEKSIQIQFDLGTDMMVCLDDCPPNEYNKNELEKSVKRTIEWAKRCRIEYEKQIKKRKLKGNNKPLLFSVIQGGAEKDLRKYCADELVKIGFDGYGFGARPVDEKGNRLEDVLAYTANLIPEDSLRFALGIGTPEDIVKCASYGWDMFDCVIPTREGRHGKLFLWKNNFKFSAKDAAPASGWGSASGGQISNFKFQKNSKIGKQELEIDADKSRIRNQELRIKALPKKGAELKVKWHETININNARFAQDFSPINENSKLPELRTYTKAYLHHLFKMREPLGARLASLNNLEFYIDLLSILQENS